MPRRNTEPLEAIEKKGAKEQTTPGLRHCHTKILPVQTKMSHAMTEVCNTLCTHGFSPTVHFHFRPQKTHQIVYCGTLINSVPTGVSVRNTFSLCRRQQLSTESRFTNSSSSASHTDHLLTRHLAVAISSRFLHQHLRQQLVHKTEEINGEPLCDNHQECATRM